jgi:hypothetical protein
MTGDSGWDKPSSCPQCGEEMLPETVVAASRSIMKVFSFEDDQGRGHLHDHNRVVVHYKCGLGHSWKVPHCRVCWCGWSAEGLQ